MNFTTVLFYSTGAAGKALEDEIKANTGLFQDLGEAREKLFSKHCSVLTCKCVLAKCTQVRMRPHLQSQEEM